MDRLKSNTILFFVGGTGSRLVSILFVRFYTSVLTTVEYGTIDIILTISSLLIPICTLSIDSAVLRFALDSVNEKNKILSVGLKITVFGCLSSLLFIPIVSFWLPAYLLSSLYISVLFVAIYNLLGAYLKGTDKISCFAIGGIINSFVFALLNIFFLKFKNCGIKGYMYSYILSYAIVIVYFLFCLGAKEIKNINFFKSISFEHAMIKYSIPLSINNSSWWINNSIDRFFLVYYRGTAENGLYSAAYKIPMIINYLSTFFINAWQISAVDVVSDEKKAVAVYIKTSYVYISFMAVVCSVLVVLSYPISKILFAVNYIDAWEYAPILLFGVLFCNISAFLGGILTAYKRTGIVFASTTLGAIVNIFLNLILIPRYGGTGAAIATCIGYVINAVYRIMYLDICHGFLVIKFRHIFAIAITVSIVALELFRVRVSCLLIVAIVVILYGDIQAACGYLFNRRK